MTGSFCTPAQFIASWKSPREVEPSPNHVIATRCSPRSLNAIASPVAISIMSGSIETIPTQPFVRSPKWTLPSRPPVMPSARPMYWAKMRAGSTPRIDVRREVAVQDAEPVLRGHRPGRAGRHGLLAEAVVERAGDLALAVERHRALLDPAHHQHRAEEPDPVLGGQVLRYVRRASCEVPDVPFQSPCGVLPLSSVGALRDLRTRSSLGRPRGVSTGRGHARVGHGGYVERQERAVWLTRMRWRLRGAWLWPAFIVLTLRRRGRAAAAPDRRRRPGGVRPRRAAGGLREPARWSRRWRRWPAVACAGAGPTSRASSPPTTRARRCCCAIAAAFVVGGVAHRSEAQAARALARTRSRARCTTTSSRPRASTRPGLNEHRRHQARARPLPRRASGAERNATRCACSSRPTSTRRAVTRDTSEEPNSIFRRPPG